MVTNAYVSKLIPSHDYRWRNPEYSTAYLSTHLPIYHRYLQQATYTSILRPSALPYRTKTTRQRLQKYRHELKFQTKSPYRPQYTPRVSHPLPHPGQLQLTSTAAHREPPAQGHPQTSRSSSQDHITTTTMQTPRLHWL
jgi:hypothetical protein